MTVSNFSKKLATTTRTWPPWKLPSGIFIAQLKVKSWIWKKKVNLNKEKEIQNKKQKKIREFLLP